MKKTEKQGVISNPIYSAYLKRFFDIMISASLLAIFSPIMAAIALLVRIKTGPPVIFAQERPGRNGRIFHFYKFRTMNNDPEEQHHLIPDKERLTCVGKFLRETSLDELPQLWNVLVGDMSLIGPRPLLKRYLPYYTEKEMVRHQVRPGITGWAQVHGRSNVPWDDRLARDIWYVENHSMLLDAKIVMMTISKVLGRKDITAKPDNNRLRYDLDKERSMAKKGGLYEKGMEC